MGKLAFEPRLLPQLPAKPTGRDFYDNMPLKPSISHACLPCSLHVEHRLLSRRVVCTTQMDPKTATNTLPMPGGVLQLLDFCIPWFKIDLLSDVKTKVLGS